MAIREISLKRRYVFKLGANIVGLIFTLITQSIVPRALGPGLYGQYNFLSNNFAQIVGFFDMGTSTGFFTKLSSRPREFGLVSFYAYFTGGVCFFILSFVAISQWSGIAIKLWPDQNIKYVYMAAVLGGMIWVVQVLGQMADAYGLTVPSEKARMAQKIIGLPIIIVLFLSHHLNLTHYFLFNYIVFIFLAVALIWVLEKKYYNTVTKNWVLSIRQITQYLREYYHFCHPLVTVGFLTLFVGLFDRWLLQIFGGNVQQGFYGMAYQIAVVCTVFTTAMNPLLMREFSIANCNNDVKQMAILFRRCIPLFYSIAAFFSCFLFVQSGKVVYIMGGSAFKGAAMSVAIMALYPIHQSYGQMIGSVFYATGRTAFLRDIGLASLLVGLAATYILIAPKDKYGLNMGSVGLAIKIVVITVLGVNVQLYFSTKLLRLSFVRYVGHQGMSIASLIVIAYCAAYIVDAVSYFRDRAIVSVMVSGTLYTFVVAVSTYCVPVLFGLNRSHVNDIAHRVTSTIWRPQRV